MGVIWKVLPEDHEDLTWEGFEYLMSLEIKLGISRSNSKNVAYLDAGMTNLKWIWTMLVQNSWDIIWIETSGIPERVWTLPEEWIEEKDLP